jgi:hypothetical protein
MKQLYFEKKIKDKNTLIRFQSLSNLSGQKRSRSWLMKSFLIFFVTFTLISLVWRCESLDYNEEERYSEQDIFSVYDRVKSILTNVYSYLPNDYLSVDGAMRSSASDDAEDVWDISDVQKFNDGSWSSVITLDNVWANMYSAIRTANLFLKEATGLTFDDIKYNTDYAELMQQFDLYPSEARFLRAFYYFELIKRYGSVPLDTTVLTIEEANKISPASYNDIVRFIVRECDAAAAKLPVSYNSIPGAETGRATKGAAMALKARTLLYAASPLNNPANDAAKWVEAAMAAKAIIDELSATYTPLPDYKLAVNDITSSAKELIFESRQASVRTFEEANTALGFVGGKTGTCPTQNLVDSYEMKATGLGINEPGSGYNPANPYANSGTEQRDPRLDMTILHNGSVWQSPQVVETWNGGLNAPPKTNATKTGYYIRKYMIESISLDPVNPSTAIHYWIIFRYAEVLLNYAEAMNEAYGPEVTGPAPLDNLTAQAAVNIVRARTGVEMPNFPAGMSQSAFRDKLRNERRVELAFEDHRFWDIRRWKIGPSTTTIRGVDITRESTNPDVYSFAPKVVETRFWDDRMYLYPIPQSEIYINLNLVQNPGWN